MKELLSKLLPSLKRVLIKQLFIVLDFLHVKAKAELERLDKRLNK